MSLESVNNRPGIRLAMSEAIALVALILTFSSWWVLPEKVQVIQKDNEKQDARIMRSEQFTGATSEFIARIDERLKRIEDAIEAQNK